MSTTSLDGRSDRAFEAEPGAAQVGDHDPGDPGAAGGWSQRRGVAGTLRRNRLLVLVAVLVLLGVAAGVLGAGGGVGRPLDLDNPDPSGGRALAQVLQQQGVEVREETRFDDVLASAGSGVTVLVLDAEVLAPQQLRRLRGSGADLVLVAPSLPVLQVLAPELTLGGVADADVAAPGCDDADAVVAGDVRGGGNRYVPAAGTPVPGVEGEPPSATARVTVCYPGPDDAVSGSYAVVADPEQDRRVVVHGQPELLSNEWLAQEGNSALALRSLGRQGTLLWYRVDPFDPALAQPDAAAPTVSQLLPSWVRWVVGQLLVVALLAVVWRFRRLGRLVPERLPAVVRSVETTEGRARLYRRAGAVGASAQVLRQASTRRLATRLSTGSVSDGLTVARLAATATGRDPVHVADLLHGPSPTDDAGLVRLADDLDRLEREVAHR